MKGLKLSKTSWLILSAGVFIVVLAGLGMTRNQQMKDQTLAEDELSISQMRLSKYDTADMNYRTEELGLLIEEKRLQVEEAKERLVCTLVSADVVEQFYEIADFSGVEVMSLRNMPIAEDSLLGVPVTRTDLSASVEGSLQNIIDFIIDLNHNFTTGYIVSSQVNVEEVENDNDLQARSSANIQVIVYSGKEAQ